MNHTLWKDTLRLIRNQKGRYLALVLIVLIGTAFYTGVTASSTMLAQNVDAYDDSLNLKDLTIYSNLGFDEDDLEAIRRISGVKLAEGTKFADVQASDGTTASIARIHSLSEGSEINQFILADGRMPENDTEVLAEAGNDMDPGYPIGSVLTLSRPDDDLEDWIKTDTVTVVGTIDTPLYLNMTKENSTLGNRYITTYLYLNESAFVGEIDTEVNIITEEGKTFNSFYQPYLDYVDTVAVDLETLAETQTVKRRESLVADAMSQYEDGLHEYEDALETYEREIFDAEEQIADAKQQIEDGKSALSEAQNQIDQGYEELENKTAQAQAEIDAGRAQYETGLSEYQQGLQEFQSTKEELEGTVLEIQDGISQIEDGISQLSQALEGGKQLDSGIAQIDAMLPAVEENYRKTTALLETYPFAENLSIGDLKRMQLILSAYQPDAEGMDVFREFLIAVLFTNLDSEDAEVLKGVLETAGEEFFQQFLNATGGLLSEEGLDTSSLGELGLSENNTLGELNAKLSELQTELPRTREQLLAQKEQLESMLAEQGLTLDTVEDRIADLSAQKQELENALQEIEDGLSAGEAELQEADSRLRSALAELQAGQAQLDSETQSARQQLADAQAELDRNRMELEESEEELLSGEEELRIQKEDGAQQLADAKAELDKALDEIESLENGTWTVLDRSKHYASETFKNTVHQMKAIADVFPVFFLLVAALVCLTTMTRMVDEERGQLGIMRALGYTRLQCAFRYLFYSGTAALVGCVLGSVVGMLTFPAIIYNAWKMMYILPTMKIFISWKVIFQATAAFLAVVLLTTWFTCAKDMREVPSQLLRPKAPKLGRAALIERVDFIWKHLSFTWKVTIRNLLRYKKRLIMTVIGVAGCTALLVTGYGVKDSIQSMVDLQFTELQHYEGSAVFEEELTLSEKKALADQISQREDVERTALILGYSTLVQVDDQEETANMLVFDSDEQLSSFFTLRTRKKHAPISLEDDGVIITEKLAENMGVSVGDEILVENKNGLLRSVRVTAVCEMYIQHYVLMSDEAYATVFGTTPGYNEVLIAEKESADNSMLQTELLLMDGVDSVSFIDSILENFQSMVNSLDLIVWVLIISSMSLAFVVLGNLTNINISERQREIATLKVLGFRRKEVQKYLFQEGNILTLVGALVGLPVGNYLHHYIMRQVEMDYIMFGRSVLWPSFVYSVVLTVAFGLLVNFFMRKRLAAVQMAESLKSVE